MEGVCRLRFKVTQADIVLPITEKQYQLIFNIIISLELDTDKSTIQYMNRDEACAFIQKYKKRYEHYKELKAICRSISGSGYHSTGRKHVDCNPFAGPHECDYMDCYDFGITPWGDS